MPYAYVSQVLILLQLFHNERKLFTAKEMEKITGMLVFIAASAPWLKFILAQVYVSLAAAICVNIDHLTRMSKRFQRRVAASVCVNTDLAIWPTLTTWSTSNNVSYWSSRI